MQIYQAEGDNILAEYFLRYLITFTKMCFTDSTSSSCIFSSTKCCWEFTSRYSAGVPLVKVTMISVLPRPMVRLWLSCARNSTDVVDFPPLSPLTNQIVFLIVTHIILILCIKSWNLSHLWHGTVPDITCVSRNPMGPIHDISLNICKCIYFKERQIDP